MEETTPSRGTPQFDWTYRVSLEDYQRFNFVLAEPEIKKRRKRSNMLGTLEVVMGVVLLISMLTAQAKSEPLYYVLDIVLILLGVYGISFYRYIFPSQLKKSAAKQYEKNLYLNNDVHFQLYEQGMEENSYETSQYLEWEEISEILNTPKLAIFILKNKKCILLPSSVVGDRMEEFQAFLQNLHDQWGVPVTDMRKGDKAQ